MRKLQTISITIGAVMIAVLFVVYFIFATRVHYTAKPLTPKKDTPRAEVKHIAMPTEGVRAVYVSQCGAASKKIRAHILDLLTTTELNAVVIDVKDYTGTVSFRVDGFEALSGGTGCVVRDMQDFIAQLHKHNIYTIARITVFQDPLFAKRYPEQAVHRLDAPDTPWRDYHGLAFIDVGSRPFWNYIIAIARAAKQIGFDELNFDYVRYPSDGPMKNVYYSHSNKTQRPQELENFFRYLTTKLRTVAKGEYVPKLSADLFGMTTTNYDDLTIGQVLERALPYFDAVAPMVYPSHYPGSFLNLGNPNEHVYTVVHYSLQKAVERTVATTPRIDSWHYTALDAQKKLYRKPAYDKNKIRPWLQDFNYGGVYDAAKVRAQIQATYDAGLNSWMLWDPSNVYTRGALRLK